MMRKPLAQEERSHPKPRRVVAGNGGVSALQYTSSYVLSAPYKLTEYLFLPPQFVHCGLGGAAGSVVADWPRAGR